MSRIIVTTLAASVLFAVPTHAQNVIVNGSFESPSIAANSVLQTTPASWVGGNLPFIINGDVSPGIPLPQDGQQYAALGHSPSQPQAASLSQAFAIGSPGTYVLNWYDSTEFNFPNFSPYSVTVTDSVANTVASLNLDADAQVLRLWTKRSLTLTLPADSYTLRFQGLVAASGEGTLIDNVSLFVPEPTTATLLILGAVGCAFHRSCRRGNSG